jgi:hypothetical protein
VAVTERAADTESGRSFRPGSRRRTRIAAGVAIAAVAVAGNVLVYASLDNTSQVVQFVDNVYAGERIASSDVRVIEVDGDITSANLVPADQLGSIVDQYARTFIPSGSLASVYVVQRAPLVAGGTAVVAIAPSGGRIPSGLTERSRIGIVIGEAPDLVQVEGRVVAVDRDDEGAANLSVEVAVADAAVVAAAQDLYIVLLDPGTDPAIATDTSETENGG